MTNCFHLPTTRVKHGSPVKERVLKRRTTTATLRKRKPTEEGVDAPPSKRVRYDDPSLPTIQTLEETYASEEDPLPLLPPLHLQETPGQWNSVALLFAQRLGAHCTKLTPSSEEDILLWEPLVPDVSRLIYDRILLHNRNVVTLFYRLRTLMLVNSRWRRECLTRYGHLFFLMLDWQREVSVPPSSLSSKVTVPSHYTYSQDFMGNVFSFIRYLGQPFSYEKDAALVRNLLLKWTLASERVTQYMERVYFCYRILGALLFIKTCYKDSHAGRNKSDIDCLWRILSPQTSYLPISPDNANRFRLYPLPLS
jgi:hypothetical protein